jgi:hypothetical protein
MKSKFKFGRFCKAKARADKNIVRIAFGNDDKLAQGLGRGELIVVCSNNVEAADWVSYINRQLPFEIEIRTTFEENKNE